ncbi:MAG: c-type cytochrome [Pseudomonadota bacterium]
MAAGSRSFTGATRVRLERLRLFWVVALAMPLAACEPDDTLEAAPTNAQSQVGTTERTNEPTAPKVFRSINVSGETAYRAACAHCHDAGEDGAPVTGDPDSWSDRSPLWEAVLAEHAKKGYFGMPARGGDESLPDTMVSRATEYMLLRTFPDRSPD